jgi:hypothetical protein
MGNDGQRRSISRVRAVRGRRRGRGDKGGREGGREGGRDALALFFPARRTAGHAHANRKELTPAAPVNKFKARLVSRIISRPARSISAAARPKITARYPGRIP